jgi:hypothetical protein
MFGVFGFIIGFGFANFPLIIAIGNIALARKKKREIPWATVIQFLLFQVVVSYFLLPLYFHQFENYYFIRTITAREVISIQVDSTTWTEPQDIETVVNSLNQAVWHETNHDIGGPFVTMTMTLQSGKIWKAHVGRYYEKDGAIFEFFHPMNEQGAYWSDGTAYVPGLMTTFENMGYSLPIR